MDHLAIMKKSWGLLDKIGDGRKSIESRWYKNKICPWNRIRKGETVYFKDSGGPITLKAKVSGILQFSGLNPAKVRRILNEYGERDGLEKNQAGDFYKLFKNKNYCLLIFLEGAQKIRPFRIDKTGFGSMAAWICIGDINLIKK